TVIAYTVPGLVSVVQSEIESFWELQGCTFTVVSTAGFPADPDGFRTALKADIASRVGAGASAIFLVGDANDHRQFTGSEYPSLWVPENGWETIRQNLLNGGYTDQSGRDLIPTFYAPDTDPRGVNMGYVTPYWMSDWEYGDVDGDVLPDVPVTRLPVTTTDEVYAYASKLWMNQVGSFGARTVGFLAGDVDHIGNEGSDVLAAMTAISSVASGTQQAWLYESAEPSIIQRNAAAADLWNSWTPEVVFILGTLSNRSWPGGFFDQTVSPPFTMDYIQSVGTHAALVVALSCGGGNFPQTEDGDYGQPIAERFLTEWFKGAIAWVGPTVGSWQTANHPLAVAFAQELFADASRPIASSFLIALRRVLTEYADDEEVVRSALSTTVLGDPLARVNQTMIPTGIADLPPPFGFGLHQNHPNPFNPATRIAYSLTRQGPVSLQVYDASGRLVRTLVNGVQPSGPHVVDWKGENDRGSHVASGPYFCRLLAEDRAMTRKMLLLK
ncbi:MAG: hypothetical protein HY566_02810, partial [Candidatus Kerfeldbacteria bacterium]|nr:hypothetical protein [Candidatus Kerfeldbacteria bacterium]